ncbi:MAG: protein-export chaperone SecB [Pseudomonadota bacterium]
MSETPATDGTNGQPETANQQPPRLSIVTQYIRDLSFENPGAQRGQQQGRPQIQVRVEVRSQNVNEQNHEVTLDLNVEAKTGEDTVFLLELSYSGLFSLANIPNESLQPLLLIECPRLLFPFARRVVADVTRDGGFPPLMIDPIDFVSLYRRRVQQARQETNPPSATA